MELNWRGGGWRCSEEGAEWNGLCWRSIGHPVSNSTPSLKAKPARPIT